MKLKYHKIRGVDKTVCTVEQRLAYELAFRAYINYNSAWGEAPDSDSKAHRRDGNYLTPDKDSCK